MPGTLVAPVTWVTTPKAMRDMETEPLQPALDKAQKTLEVALEEACGVDLSKIDTGELIRIEETLVSASQAAKDAVSLRLRRRTQRAHGGAGSARGGAATEEPAPITHRVFDDIRGKRWHAFAVHGSEATVERAGLPDAFKHGWLVFESKEEVRRVAPIPEKWEELSIDELRQLCYSAAASPRRIAVRGTPRDTEPPAKA